MAYEPRVGGRVRFGVFELDTRAGQLRKHGVKLRLGGQPLQVLEILLERAGEVVTREELQSRIWPANTFVDFDHGLHNAISRIREVLSDSGETPRYIETLPRRGYRFIGALEGPPPSLPPTKPLSLTEPLPRTETPERRLIWPYLVVALTVFLAALGAVWYLRSPQRSVTSPSEFVQLTNFDDSATAPALSSDGRIVTFLRGGSYFLGTGQIFVKLLPNGESKQLTSDDAVKYGPVFTPDGSRVAYTVLSSASRSWDTWTVPVLGGPATLLMRNTAGLSWIGPGRVLFSEVKPGTALHMGIVSALENRAEERAIYFPAHERAMAHYSWLSPDRRSVLVVEMDRTAVWQRCRLVPVEGGSGAQVGPQGACLAAAWSPDGQWMYFNAEVSGSMHLWRQRVRDGVLEQITFGPAEEEGLAMEPDGKSVVTSIGSLRTSVWTHDASGDHAVSVEGSASSPKLSADGKRLFYLLRKNNTTEVKELWSQDTASGQLQALLTGLQLADYDISPDEKEVAFTVHGEGAPQILIAPLDRSQPQRVIVHGGDEVSFAGGGQLVFRQLNDKVNYLARTRTDGSGFERVLDSPILNKGTVSPDGEWAIVTGNTSEGVLRGTVALSLRDHAHRQICAGLCWIGWSADGKFLYVSTRLHLNTSQGRTLVIPMPHSFAALGLPSSGLDIASEEDGTGFQSIARVNMSPGLDPETYAFSLASFTGNLFRLPLH